MKQKMYKKIMALAGFLLAVNFVLAGSAPALAVGSPDDLWGGTEKKDYVTQSSGLPSSENASDPRLIISQVIKVILGFLGILAVVIILFAGFKWMTSGGNEDKVGEAKKMLIAGIIGLVIILASYALADFVITNIYKATTGTL